MTAHAPNPSGEADADLVRPDADEVLAAIDGLRRKIDDNATALRQQQRALGELAESVGKLVAQQRKRERSFTLSSFVAYLLFTVLLGGGFFALYQSRADELVTARDAAHQARDDAQRRAEDAERALAARDAAAARAHAYWKLLEEGKRDEAIATYPDVQAAALTPTERELFAAREREARGAIVDAGYLEGLDAYRAGKLKEAIAALDRALGYEEEGPRAAHMRYLKGVAKVKTGAAEEGAQELVLAIAGRVDQSGVSDARYWLGAAYEALGRFGEARAEYDKFATAQPQHPLSVAARRKSAALAYKAKPTN